MKQKHLCRLALLTLATTALSVASAFAAPAGTLNLDAYLDQVEEKDPGLKSARAGAEGYQMLRESGDLLTSPNFIANYTRVNNQEEPVLVGFQASRTRSDSYSVGLGMNTSFGLSGKYTFNVSDTNLAGLSPAVQTPPVFSTSYNKFELTQSLVKNGFGSQIRARRDLIDAGNLANEYNTKFQAQDRRVSAENAFWRLAFARRSVEIQEDVLARADRALQWARRRTNLQLGDRSDFLQAQASYDLRRLELQAAKEEVKNAGRAFNLFRNVEGETVAETLNIPSIDQTIAAKSPARGTRLDILAAEQQQKAAEAQAQVNKEELKPTVDLFANLAWTGRDVERNPAVKEGFTSKNPNTSIGVNVTVPLAIGQTSRSLQGYELAKEASRLTLEQSRLNETQGWSELTSKLADAQARLGLLRTIEATQKDKYENERQRLLRGRTTTFQALQFEQEYAQTQLTTLRTHSEVLGLLAQMKLFQGEEQ